MTAPTIGVCGYGRCGSTMVMTMLTAGGVPAVAGTQPGSFEVADLEALMALAPEDLAGRCVKLLDVVALNGGQAPPAGQWRFVWLDRSALEQAKSATKFAIAFGLLEPFEHRHEMLRHLRELVDSYRMDRARRLGQLRELGPVTTLAFEQVLANPGRAARHLAKLAPDLDRRAAAAVVHRRTGDCRPDLSVELALSITEEPAPVTVHRPLAPKSATEEWKDAGACLDHPEIDFFPSQGEATDPAKRVCEGCHVRRACLEYALTLPLEKFGIWGGTSARERRSMTLARVAANPLPPVHYTDDPIAARRAIAARRRAGLVP